MSETHSREEYRARIEQVVTYITTHLEEPLNLENIAGMSHFSPYHFHRIFTAVMGETPQDLVNRLRLERAANLLLKSTRSVTEIAFACGFSSSSTFARSFKRHFGISAGAYARRGVEIIPPLSIQGMPASFTPPEIRMAAMPGLHLATIADMRGYALEDICRAWEKLYRWACAREIITNETHMVGISFDDPLITPPEKCRYYACLSVPQTVGADNLVGVLDIPAARCVVCRALVPPEHIQLIYRYFYSEWLPDSGLQPASFPAYEIYYETPENNSQGKFLMEVCIPVLSL
jgi:AraC family transcriptional regulator